MSSIKKRCYRRNSWMVVEYIEESHGENDSDNYYEKVIDRE